MPLLQAIPRSWWDLEHVARREAACTLSLIISLLLSSSAAVAQPCSVRPVPRDELVRAMGLHGEYDILATTNRGRFASELILRLARWARDRDPQGPPLYISPEDWFFAYIQTAGVSMLEAPRPALLGLEHGQRVMIEYRSDRVLHQVPHGPEPRLAVNVRAWWPEAPNSVSSFSFTDTTATPKLKVTSHREVTYRLLEFDDMIVLDRIEGVSGRPVSGLLGRLFDIIGEAGLRHSRITISDDGVQVVRGRAKKIFSVSTTVTIEPDGRATKGIPSERPDLATLQALLERKLELDYVPYAWESVAQGCY